MKKQNDHITYVSVPPPEFNGRQCLCCHGVEFKQLTPTMVQCVQCKMGYHGFVIGEAQSNRAEA
ncbi:MAG: hypothetical protein NVS1B6_00230 [Steroidobacteraceae bacterium]